MGDRRVLYGVLVGRPEVKRKLGVDWRIILKFIFKKWDLGGMDWIALAQDRDGWRALVIAVMNIWVS
jgi:hypothetical protein